ncbi:MAG: hypothetical protein ACK502_07695 [Alphaproteobacteria bacterium]
MPAKKNPSKKLIILAVLVAAGAYVYMNLGSFITRTTEKIASDALGVKVAIGSIDVSLYDKKVTVHSIKVGNPSGYRKPHALTAESIHIGLNTASKEIIDFNDIQVKGSVVNVEINEKGMNLTDLKALANKKEQKESVGSEQIRVIIKHLVIDASTINTSIAMLDKDIQSIQLPALKFSNIGGDKGVDAGKAIEQVVTKYLGSVESAARQNGLFNGVPGLGDAKGVLDDAAKGLNSFFR